MTDPPVALGLDYGGTKIAVAVSDLTGARLGAATIPTMVQSGAESAMDRSLEAARELLTRVAPGRPLAAVGASTLGIPFDDRVELAPTFPGWSQLPIGRRLREAFPDIPIRLSTDVKAAAAAELRWGALIDCDPGIYLNLGTGLASAIVAGGTIVNGAHGASGEIAYNLRRVGDVWLPERDILEDRVSGQALARRGSCELGREVDAAEVFAHSETKAAGLLTEFIRELALHVVNLAIAVDPARIVVGGGMVRSWDRIAPGLHRAIHAAVPFPPELRTAQFPFDAPLIGALALGVEAAGAIGEAAWA
ncbi:MAG TPA: ROK family protein [Mycobacteriales bacterium]|nr:ROK family protein [Mycobacteriales bacterium]